METKDYYTVCISLIALIVSIFSNFFQKAKENRRAIRKNLSDTLESVVKINIESVKLKNSELGDKPETFDLRRNYNSQRRILVAHADYLISNYDTLVTDIDCNIIATAYTSIGDYNMADQYWKKTIEKSNSEPIKHMNLRGYASFLFNQGKVEAARGKYRESLAIELPDSDASRSLLADTYLLWANLERNFKNKNEAKKLIDDAISCCSRIGNKNMRIERENQIKHIQLSMQ